MTLPLWFLICLVAAAVAATSGCMQPSGGRAREPSPRAVPTDGPPPAPSPSASTSASPDDTTHPGAEDPATDDVPQNDADDDVPASDDPPVAAVTFAAVRAILKKDAYGPCTTCHEREWPYLSRRDDGAWDRFLASLQRTDRGAATKEELAALLVACVDPDSEARCAGDPADPSDNLDFKMPSKFGYDALSAEDLATFSQWLRDGANGP